MGRPPWLPRARQGKGGGGFRRLLVGACLIGFGVAGLAGPDFAAAQAAAQSAAAAPGPEATYGLPLHGAEAEAFLKTAEVVKTRALPLGVTHSEQLTLSDGVRTLKATWKTIDERRHGTKSLEGGGLAPEFVDSWKYEVAAYELDKLLGFDLVPPAVERRLRGKDGALQMWVEGVITEWDRVRRKLRPPNPERWNRQIYCVRVLHALTHNTDYRNLRNELVDPDFRVYAIDFSRAFRVQDFIPTEKDLQRFPRDPLEKMKTLDRPRLDAALGRWLTGPEIAGLLRRRDRLLALLEKRVQEKGEAAVLFP
jgi:hypothetical protein